MLSKTAFISAIALAAAAASATAQPAPAAPAGLVQQSVYRSATARELDPEQCLLRAGCNVINGAWFCPNPKAYLLCDIG